MQEGQPGRRVLEIRWAARGGEGARAALPPPPQGHPCPRPLPGSPRTVGEGPRESGRGGLWHHRAGGTAELGQRWPLPSTPPADRRPELGCPVPWTP